MNKHKIPKKIQPDRRLLLAAWFAVFSVSKLASVEAFIGTQAC